MDTVTYPDAAVAREIEGRFVAAKIESGKQPDLARSLGIRWLPGLAVVDADGRAASVQTGFLPPGDLLPELAFGRAIFAMGQKRYDEAHALFQELLGQLEAERAPEAAYWWGISRFRQTKDFAASMREPWGEILRRWPRSQWARKVGWALGRA